MRVGWVVGRARCPAREGGTRAANVGISGPSSTVVDVPVVRESAYPTQETPRKPSHRKKFVIVRNKPPSPAEHGAEVVK